MLGRILSWLLGLVGGGGWIWIVAALGVSALGAATTAALWYRDAAHVAQGEARQAAERLAQNAAALEELRRERDRAMAAVEAEARVAAARETRASQLRRTIDATPRTDACVASPAVSAALAGLRRRGAAGGEGGAGGGAGQPADLRPAAGDPGRGPVRR